MEAITIGEFLDKMIIAIDSKPLVIALIIGIVTWGVVTLKLGRNPFRSRKEYVEKKDLREVERRLETALTAHNKSNDCDFKEVKEDIGDLGERMDKQFQSLTTRIDDLFKK